MPINIVHDFLQETENGYVLTVYLARDNINVEFASELGRFERRIDDRDVFMHMRSKYPGVPINHIRVVTGDAEVVTLTYMSMLADVQPNH